MGPTLVLLAPGGPHAGPMNLAIREYVKDKWHIETWKSTHQFIHRCRDTTLCKPHFPEEWCPNKQCYSDMALWWYFPKVVIREGCVWRGNEWYIISSLHCWKKIYYAILLAIITPCTCEWKIYAVFCEFKHIVSIPISHHIASQVIQIAALQIGQTGYIMKCFHDMVDNIPQVLYHTWVWNREICRCVIVRPRSHMLIVRRKIVPIKTIKYFIFSWCNW